MPGAITTVTFTATDDCGLTETATSTVTVVDTTAPEVTVPAPLVLECDGPGGIPATDPRIQAWLAEATATDVCDGAVLTHDAPDFFAAGCDPGLTTIVTFRAVDDCGNEAVEASSVTVVDSTPPEISSVGFDGICLWPPNHKYYCIEDVTEMVVASDLCLADPPVISITECSSSQPEDGLGDGHTLDDCVLINGGKGFCARSERLGNDPLGRFYDVVVAATDECGNTSTHPAQLYVPHDQSPHEDCERPNRGKKLTGT